MAEPLLTLRYDGGDADGHVIDMRLLGQSLQGADRITSDGLIVFAHGRPPKRGERAPLVVKVREPIEGSYNLPGMLQDAAWMLPLGMPIATDLLATFISHWWQVIKARFTGKRGIEEVALEAIMAMTRDHLAARDASEARAQERLLASEAQAHDRQMTMLNALQSTVAMQQRAIEQFVAPIGKSVTSALMLPDTAPPVAINLDEADQIRDAGELQWEGLAEIVLRTDGFRFHTSGLSIENPERTGFLMAKVHDPRFEHQENVYTEAAQRRSEIVVLARRGYKNGELVRIEIVDFVREIPA
jgi:hypothetical protein